MVPHWCIAVVAALLLVTHTTAATAFSSPLTGSSFFWMTLTGTAAVKQQLQTDLESDMQAAAGAAGTVTVTDLNVNATALFVEYTIVSAGSVEAVQATVLASPLPTVEAYVETSKSSLSAIADLIPETVVFDPHVLYPRPGGEPAPAPVIVSAMTSGHRILVSGDAAVWQRVMDDQASALTTAIQASVESAVYRPLMTTTSTVQRYGVQQVGSKDAMGGPEGGLVVELTVSQELWEGGQGTYSIDELNGVLLTMELSAVSALYTAAGGTVPPQPRVVVASEITDPGFVCTAVCKGFIATLSITGGITVILIVLMVVFTCCCGWPTTRGDESNSDKEQTYGEQAPYA